MRWLGQVVPADVQAESFNSRALQRVGWSLGSEVQTDPLRVCARARGAIAACCQAPKGLEEKVVGLEEDRAFDGTDGHEHSDHRRGIKTSSGFLVWCNGVLCVGYCPLKLYGNWSPPAHIYMKPCIDPSSFRKGSRRGPHAGARGLTGSLGSCPPDMTPNVLPCQTLNFVALPPPN